MTSKKTAFVGIVIFLATVVALALVEGILRLMGHTPNAHRSKGQHEEPTMHEPDPILGWRNKKGHYLITPYHPSGSMIEVNFLDHGQRRTSGQRNLLSREIVVVGCSFTQGWAISDNETYAWKLQDKYPSWNVLNYGTGGYGTYQSLLVLERELPRLPSPKIILYGFIGNHENRNVAPDTWLASLASLPKRGHIAVPFATFDEDRDALVRHPPTSYISFPLRESLAAAALTEQAYMKALTMRRYAQRQVVTERLVLDMNNVAKKFNARLTVVILSADEKKTLHYTKFFANNNVAFIDCTLGLKTHKLPEDMKVPGEGHPNEKMNTRWAQCISDSLFIGNQ